MEDKKPFQNVFG